MGGDVLWLGDGRRAHKILLGKPKGRGRSKISWEDNFIWVLKEIDYEGDRKTFVQDRVIRRAYVLSAMNLWVP